MKLFKKNRDWCHVFPKLDNYLTSAKRTKEKIAKRKQRKRKKELAAKAALRKLQRKRLNNYLSSVQTIQSNNKTTHIGS